MAATYLGDARQDAHTGGVLTAKPPPTVNPSCFGTLEDAAHKVAEVADRVERLVSRLVGNYPEAAAGAEIKTGPDGLLDEATNRALHIKGNVAAMHCALDRLEKVAAVALADLG